MESTLNRHTDTTKAKAIDLDMETQTSLTTHFGSRYKQESMTPILERASLLIFHKLAVTWEDLDGVSRHESLAFGNAICATGSLVRREINGYIISSKTTFGSVNEVLQILSCPGNRNPFLVMGKVYCTSQ